MSETSLQSTCQTCTKTAYTKAFDCYRTTLRNYALAPDWETKKALHPQNEIVLAEVQRARNARTWATDPDCEVCNSQKSTAVTPTVDDRTAASNNGQQRVGGPDDVDKQSLFAPSAQSVQSVNSQKPDAALTTQLDSKVDSTIEPGAADDDWHEVGQEDYGAGNPESDDEDWAAAKDMGLNLW